MYHTNEADGVRLSATRLGLVCCVGCGTCAGICPESAIEMLLNSAGSTYFARQMKGTCTDCGLCAKVCPFAFARSDESESGPADVRHLLMGDFDNCYVGHSMDEMIRFNSSSGGLVTSLLIFALERGIIDGAVVTMMKNEDPFNPKPFVARTRTEILQASGSKYCPVPLNVALKEVLESDEKVALVGLPCHIRGARLAGAVNRTIRDRVVIHLGLFCSHTPSFIGTKFLCRKIGIERSEVSRIEYRTNGWPGGMEIVKRSGEKLRVPNQSTMSRLAFGSLLFSPFGCLFCADATAELADLSFGDPWLEDVLRTERIGKSIVIERTAMGKRILADASACGIIDLSNIDSKRVIESQKATLHFKKMNLIARMRVGRYGCSDSLDGASIEGSSWFNNVLAIPSVVLCNLCNREFAQDFLLRAPMSIILLYESAYSYLYSKLVHRDFEVL